MQYMGEIVPCEFCNVILPLRFSQLFLETWKPSMSIFNLSDSSDIISVDKTMQTLSTINLSQNFEIGNGIIEKIHCLHNYGNAFVVRHILPCISNLKGLNLSGLTLGVSDIQIIANNCTKLEELVLRVMPTVDCLHLIYIYLNNNNLKHFHLMQHKQQQCFCLAMLPLRVQHLSLTLCNYPFQFRYILMHLQELTRLRLDYCTNVPNTFIYDVLELNPNLNVLRHNFAYDIPKYIALTENTDIGGNLTVLALFNNCLIDNDLLTHICKTCKQLRKLFLGSLDFHTADFLELHMKEKLPLLITSESISRLYYLTKLTTLGLFGLRIEEDTNKSLLGLQYIASLEVLYLITDRNRNVTDVVCNVIKNVLNIQIIFSSGYEFPQSDIDKVVKTLENINFKRPSLHLTVDSVPETQKYYHHVRLFVCHSSLSNFISVIEHICA